VSADEEKKSDDSPIDLLSATSLVAASMIGAGVYTTSGFTLADLGSPSWVIAAWTVGGVIAISGAICYGALARELTQSGGEYMFLSRALHPAAGLMAGWVSILAGFTGAIAFAASAFEAYLGLDAYPIPNLLRTPGFVSSSVVVLAAILHTIGVRGGARIQDAVVVLKFFLIAAFIAIALWSIPSGGHVASSPIPTQTSVSPFEFALKFSTALVWISLSYSGFNAAVYVAGEVKHAERNVPLALLLGTVSVTTCYLALNAIFVFGAPVEAVAGKPDVATAAAEAIAGPAFGTFVRMIILFGLFTSVSALIMSGPRVYAKMADDGVLPKWFRFSGRPPIVAIWAQATLAIIVIHLSSLKQLLSYLGFTLSVTAALTVSLLFWVRGRSGERIRGRFYPIPPMIFVGGTLLTATLSAVATPIQAIAGLVTIGFGGLVYLFQGRRLYD